MREGRGGWRVYCDAADRALLDPSKDVCEAFEIHGLRQAVPDRFVHQRMIGNLSRTLTDHIVLTGQRIGKHRCHQVLGFHSLNLWWNLSPAHKPEENQRAADVPAPAGHEHGGLQHRLDHDFPNRL